MNLRVIKKDIDFLTDEFLSDAFISMSFHNDTEKVEKIIDLTNEALDLHDDIRARVNQPEGNKRAYYRNLIEEMLSALDALYDKLSETIQNK